MLQQKSVAVDYRLNRATECEKLADLPSEHREKVVYRKLARTWMNLARPCSEARGSSSDFESCGLKSR